MMHHHLGADYAVASSEAATRARSIMEEKIARGKASAERLWESVHSAVPTDAVVRGRAMQFGYGLDVEHGEAPITVPAGGTAMTIHRHALQQLATKAGIPGQFLSELVASPDAWRRELAARILGDHYGRATVVQGEDLSTSRHLVRAVGGQVRGFLSDHYRRLDSRPLLEAFAGACQELQAVPVEGIVTDTRVALKAFLPMVFEPVPNEVMCLGVEWSNSDFGAGKHALRTFLFRLWCSNGATVEDALSQVHLGARLADNIEFSDRTLYHDTQAQVGALGDVVRGALGPKGVSAVLDSIRQADEKKVEWKAVSNLIGRRLLKDELKLARDAFESDDVINLPAAKSVWRASNAISWIAGKVEDQDRRLDLERLAGAVLRGKVEVEAAA